MTHRRSQPDQFRRRTAAAAARALDRATNPFEPLERRVMLSGGGYKLVTPPGGFQPTTQDIADYKNGPMASAGQTLINLYREYRRFQKSGADGEFEPAAQFDDILIKGDRVGVTVRGRNGLDNLTQRLRDAGAELIYRNRQWTVIEAYVPLAQLHELARDPQVANINPMHRAQTKQAGSANNQADFVMKTSQVRNDFGLDGSGVTVGVISDSVNAVGDGLGQSFATNDLPRDKTKVIVDEVNIPNTDEGRGMLELIHDIAPEADLQFAASGVSLSTFADNVRALRAAGSDVIVDDIGFSNEPVFQPGVLELAITDVVNDGAVYLSAAGNSADAGYEAPTRITRVGRERFVDFDPGAGVDTRLRITGGGTYRLWWDNPYNGVVGEATTDLDIFIYDATYGRVRGEGTANNVRTGRPIEIGTTNFFGEIDIEIRVADHVEGAALPTRFRLMGEGLQDAEHEPEAHPTILGHSGHFDTISVGAVPFFNPSENEDFSSHGPITYLFDFDGGRLGAPQNLQKPDISGIDDTNTSFFGQDSFADDDVFPNFGGTSAAAPNVAGLVALIREVQPDASQAQIIGALETTAVPLNSSPGGWEPVGGHGLVDADAAVQTFVTPPTVHVKPVRPDPLTRPIDNLKIIFSQVVQGFDISDLTLTRDGGPNLLTGAQTLRSTDGGRTWLLRELRGITDAVGTYTLTLSNVFSGITNTSIFAHPLAEGTSETWERIAIPTIPTPPGNLRAKVVGEGVVRLRWDDLSGNEDRFVVQRAEDEDFTQNVKSFNVPKDTTVFTDEVIIPVGKRVFYRVRAINDFSEFRESSNVVEVFLPGAGEVIVDNESSSGLLINGAWTAAAATQGTLGDSFLTDQNSAKGTKNVRYQPNIPRGGEYFVYARWARTATSATNVPIDVVHGPNGSIKKTITVDQRNEGGAGWVLLGKFSFDRGRSGFVRVRTDGTNGLVTIDAVRFQPATGAD